MADLPITFDLIEAHLSALLPSSAYGTRIEDSRNGPVFSIIPANPRAAELSIWVGENAGQCDIAFGRAFSREIELEDGESLLELIDAVTQGKLVEHIWKFGNRELYSKSSLQLRNGQAVVSNGFWLLYPPCLKHTYRYEPF